ncbi:homeobox-leucine zipper protein ROC3 [Trifolium repens]|nr:homeobox-leucine zipper protein ROC3 [Trifolium repens]
MLIKIKNFPFILTVTNPKQFIHLHILTSSDMEEAASSIAIDFSSSNNKTWPILKHQVMAKIIVLLLTYNIIMHSLYSHEFHAYKNNTTSSHSKLIFFK